MEKVFKKKCPKCDKVISSLYEKQFNYNYDLHVKSHEKEVKNGKEN